MKLYCLGLVMGLGVGVLGSIGLPNQPDQYTVTAKAACLPSAGIPLRLTYIGRGTVDILVLPPSPGATPEKEQQ